MGLITKENKICYIMGDFNLNLMNHQSHQLTAEFLDVMFGYMFFPLITLPTRITSHTGTIIDNIFTKHSDNYSINDLLLSDISDHLPIFCVTRSRLMDRDDDKYIVFRDKNATNVVKFRHFLSNINWQNLEGFYDPLKAYECFLSKYRETYYNCFPLNRIKKRK